MPFFSFLKNNVYHFSKTLPFENRFWSWSPAPLQISDAHERISLPCNRNTVSLSLANTTIQDLIGFVNDVTSPDSTITLPSSSQFNLSISSSIASILVGRRSDTMETGKFKVSAIWGANSNKYVESEVFRLTSIKNLPRLFIKISTPVKPK